MTNNTLTLLTRVSAGVVVATGMFAMVRINCYGRVFNWPPQPAKAGLPALPHREK